MWRDTKRLLGEKIDVLVIGSGIHGATIARASAEAGFSVALVEKNDFCSGASANSLKVIHGGIRYLQHLNIKRMRESIRSRNRLLREFPHLVRTLPCLTPTYGHGMKGREVMGIALKLNDIIGWDRNRGVDEKSRIPCGHLLTRQDCLAIMPGIREEGLTGAALWYDVIAENTERLVLEFLHCAVARGAVVANYAMVDGFDRNAETISAVHFTDTLTRQRATIHPRFIINASGASIDQFSTIAGKTPVARGWAKAVNLVVDREFFGKYGVGLEGVREFYDKDAVVQKGKRLFFFVPWRGKTMIGTSYGYYRQGPEKVHVTPQELTDFLDEVNGIYPRAALTSDDVSHVHCGLVPIMDQEPPTVGDVRLDKTTTVVDHSTMNGPVNFLTVKGVKYTTAVEVADHVVHAVSARLGSPSPPRREMSRPPEITPASESEVEQEIITHLSATYGARAQRVLAHLANGGSEVICRDPYCLAAEILHGIRDEAGLCLEDILFRRTGLASAGCPQRTVVERVAAIMGDELGWSDGQRKEEISTVFQSFALLK